jgi:hypothetical protein
MPSPTHAADRTTGSIPSAYRKRKRLWINSSVWLNAAECPYASLSVQTLGYAERMLLEMEARLAAMAGSPARKKKERDRILMECSAHSALWIFGLYEVLRTVKEAEAPQFASLAVLFRKLEILRMPLAKHEVKRVKGHASPSHYPTGCQDIETGQVGWIIHDPGLGENVILSRTLLADEFLSIAAVEPEFPHPFPIGGPLGEDDE